jgi:NAD(P)-dependent dehydrogenase (short-subunit alcohol dehydrogenase family)
VPGRLEGKVAIITGGTSGIGRAGALLFAREGARVAIGALDAADGEPAVESLRAEGLEDALFVPTDVSRADDAARLVKRSVERFGRLDVLYSNAGMDEGGTAVDTSHESWERVVGVNLTGHFNVAKYAIPALARSGGGSIILTASELGLVGAHSSVAYCAAKGGVVNMTRAMAIDCAPLTIRVNCLCPGPVDTPLIRRWFGQGPDAADRERVQTEAVLFGRLGRPEEIAGAALFLASDESSFMTGSIMVVDGGVTTGYGV